MRRWIEQPGPLPNGVARAWFAVEQEIAWCGIFQLTSMGHFILAYHKAGEPNAITEKLVSFDQAQERAIVVLNQGGLIPRKSFLG